MDTTLQPPDPGSADDALRRSALRTSQSILAAQRRAEQALIEARRSLEDQTRQLAHSLSLLHATLDASPDGVLAVDLAGTIVMNNARWMQMWQPPQEVITSRSLAAFDAFVASTVVDPAAYRAARERVVVQHLDGRWLERLLTPQQLNGRGVGTVIHWRDITERQRADQLQRERDAAEMANRAKSDFISRMSHELRTPLNAILGFSQLLEMEGQQRGDQRIGDMSRHVVGAGRHLLALVDDLLDVSRLESGQLALRRDAVPMEELVPEALSLVSGMALQNQVLIESRLEPGAWHVHGDRTRMRQVLVNLLSNAIKYNRPKGEVLVALGGDADHVRLSVRDTGRGLSAAQQAGLFEAFNRLGAEGSAVQGTGLGLVISRHLVLAMGGELSVHSEADIGSTFTLQFARR